ncbi:MAG: tRNA (adenosine(37)-N6)-threonylcarbamoyltransferase complex transferase subunit TsaD, partial [Proteobacteria bacterium]|nr:tRNA (adenosine(37)-N6)-threonylcarbamoyltransferase complex transferase subunit TsaD [Pseudomonadota bacterium]
LGLPHPAGPAIENLAKTGNPHAIKLPHPLKDQSLNFSFSGLKTAVREHLLKHPDTNHADLAASFQHTAAEILTYKTKRAIQQTQATQVVAAGGVAANLTIRAKLQQICAEHHATFSAPPLKLCGDNAVMIAYAAGLRHLANLPNTGLPTAVRPRWPLSESHI